MKNDEDSREESRGELAIVVFVLTISAPLEDLYIMYLHAGNVH